MDKIVYITKIWSRPAQIWKLSWDVIAVEKHTIFSFKLNQVETLLKRLLVSWEAENYHHHYVWKEAYVKHNKIKSIV